jgi:RNA binding exosome subunit
MLLTEGGFYGNGSKIANVYVICKKINFHASRYFILYFYKSRQSSSTFAGFFGSILENMKQEFSKNKELQESLKKFREDAKKLEDSQELKDARRKFESIEGHFVIKCS